MQQSAGAVTATGTETGATGGAGNGAEAGSGGDVVAQVEADLETWQATVPRNRGRSDYVAIPVDPCEDGGLPAGWVTVSRYAEFEPGRDLVLIRRPQGDWLIFHYNRDMGSSRVTIGAATFMGLYRLAFSPDDYPTLHQQAAGFESLRLQRGLSRCGCSGGCDAGSGCGRWRCGPLT